MKYNDSDSTRHAHYAREVWEAADLMDALPRDEIVGEELDDHVTLVSAFALPSLESRGLIPHISIRTRQASLFRRTAPAARLSSAQEFGICAPRPSYTLDC